MEAPFKTRSASSCSCFLIALCATEATFAFVFFILSVIQVGDLAATPQTSVQARRSTSIKYPGVMVCIDDTNTFTPATSGKICPATCKSLCAVKGAPELATDGAGICITSYDTAIPGPYAKQLTHAHAYFKGLACKIYNGEQSVIYTYANQLQLFIGFVTNDDYGALMFFDDNKLFDENGIPLGTIVRLIVGVPSMFTSFSLQRTELYDFEGFGFSKPKTEGKTPSGVEYTVSSAVVRSLPAGTVDGTSTMVIYYGSNLVTKVLTFNVGILSIFASIGGAFTAASAIFYLFFLWVPAIPSPETKKALKMRYFKSSSVSDGVIAKDSSRV